MARGDGTWQLLTVKAWAKADTLVLRPQEGAGSSSYEVPRASILLALDRDFWAESETSPWIEICNPCVTLSEHATYPRPPVLTEDGGALPPGLRFAIGPTVTVPLVSGRQYVVPSDGRLLGVQAPREGQEVQLIRRRERDQPIAGPGVVDEAGRLLIHEVALSAGDVLHLDGAGAASGATLLLRCE